MEQISNHPLYMKHNLDSAMGSLWEFYRKRFLTLFFISFVISIITQYVSSFINIQELAEITDQDVLLAKLQGMIVPIIGISLINLLLNAILQYYVIFNPIGGSKNIFDAALQTTRYMIPYLIIIVLLAIFASVALVLGIFLLVVGAVFAMIYVMSIYLFILPVMMAEGTDISNTIGRTFTLVHKNFWPNIGWVAVFFTIVLVLSVITSGIVLIPFTGSFVKGILNPADTANLTDLAHRPLFILLSALAGAVTLPLVPVFSCILYFNGKAREDVTTHIENEDQKNRPLRVEDLYAKPYSDDHPDNPEKKELQ
jgi:hypothetical protein